MLVGDVAEDHDGAVRSRGDAAVEHELPAVERRRPDPEAPARPGGDRLPSRHVPRWDLERPTVQVPRVEERGLDLHACGDREQRAGGGVRRRGRGRADEDAVGDAFEHRVELEPLALAERALGDRRQARESLQELGGGLGVVVRQRLVPHGVACGSSLRCGERDANDERRRRLREARPPLRVARVDVGPQVRPGSTSLADDDREPLAAEERERPLRQDLEGLREGRGLVDGDRRLDQLAVARGLGRGRGRPHVLGACAHRVRFGTCLTTIGIGSRNLYP